MRCSILIKTEMVEKPKPFRSSRSWPRGKNSLLFLSCYLLDTFYLLGFEETSIRQKFNTQHHFSKLPLLQKALKKSQAFEEFFFFSGNLIVLFWRQEQRNKTAQSQECPLNSQSHCSQQLFSLMEVQWAQQTQITRVFFSETATHNISLPAMKSDSGFLLFLKHTFPLLPNLFVNNPDLTDVLSDQSCQLLKSQRLFNGVLWILYLSSVSSYHNILICSKSLYAWLYTALIVGVSDKYAFLSVVISWQVTTINLGSPSKTRGFSPMYFRNLYWEAVQQRNGCIFSGVTANELRCHAGGGEHSQQPWSKSPTHTADRALFHRERQLSLPCRSRKEGQRLCSAFLRSLWTPFFPK